MTNAPAAARAGALQWTAHPAKRRPHDVALVAAVVLLTAGAVLASLESILLTGLAVVILLVAVAAFLLPTHYVISDAGIEERRLFRRRRRAWKELRRLQVGPGALLVSPFATKNRLDRYRGLIVYFDGGDREAIINAVKERLGHAA